MSSRRNIKSIKLKNIMFNIYSTQQANNVYSNFSLYFDDVSINLEARRQKELPSLIPHSLNLLHRRIKRKLEQLPPPLTLQILTSLTTAHMELLLIRLSPNPIHCTIDLDHSNSTSEINAPFMRDKHLASEFCAEFDRHAADFGWRFERIILVEHGGRGRRRHKRRPL